MRQDGIKLIVVTPRGEVLNKEGISSVSFYTIKGEIEVLPLHTPMVTCVEPSILKFKSKENPKVELRVIGKGFAEITNEKVLLVVDNISDGKDIDVEVIEKELKEIIDLLQQGKYDVDSLTFANLYYKKLWLERLLMLKKQEELL